jgi:NADPH-dependent 2,4-dienoyl-CoA reductase/sulfur reductase-like enzyme
VRSLEQLRVYTPEFFARERRIQVRTQAEVVAISHARRELTLHGGERVPYDKLVIATGARREMPQGDNVFKLDTWADAERLQTFLQQRKPKRAAIVGGGYIGLEAAEALRAQGLGVELYQRSGDLLKRQDPWLTGLVAKHLERCRVVVHWNSTVVMPDADLVIIAAGMRPSVRLAADAGVELGRTGAIRVTDRMESNLHGVYAAGDCAEATHLVTGRAVWIPLGTTANKMGRVAGATAAGARERFPGIVGTCIVRVCGLGVGLTGLSEAQARKEGFDPVSAQVEALDKSRYFRGKAVQVSLTADRRTGRLLGGAVVSEENVAGRINVIATALHQRMPVEEFCQLDLAYAPPYATVWDPVLLAAQQLDKLLH